MIDVLDFQLFQQQEFLDEGEDSCFDAEYDLQTAPVGVCPNSSAPSSLFASLTGKEKVTKWRRSRSLNAL